MFPVREKATDLAENAASHAHRASLARERLCGTVSKALAKSRKIMSTGKIRLSAAVQTFLALSGLVAVDFQR